MTAEIGSDVVQRRGAQDREDEQDLLGGVGDRRDGVGGEDGERGLLAQPFVLETVARERAADEQPLEAREWAGAEPVAVIGRWARRTGWRLLRRGGSAATTVGHAWTCRMIALAPALSRGTTAIFSRTFYPLARRSEADGMPLAMKRVVDHVLRPHPRTPDASLDDDFRPSRRRRARLPRRRRLAQRAALERLRRARSRRERRAHGRAAGKLEAGAAPANARGIRLAEDHVATLDAWIRLADNPVLNDDTREAAARTRIGDDLRAIRALSAPRFDRLLEDERETELGA